MQISIGVPRCPASTLASRGSFRKRQPGIQVSAKFLERVMNLFERLWAAEHQGRDAAREGFTRARTSLEEAQSRLRRKMRIHPRTRKPGIPLFVSLEERNDSIAPPAIVTVNGKDLPPEEPETTEEVA
jgi:hypothetical protein